LALARSIYHAEQVKVVEFAWWRSEASPFVMPSAAKSSRSDALVLLSALRVAILKVFIHDSPNEP
jgi:hypothetical protein